MRPRRLPAEGATPRTRRSYPNATESSLLPRPALVVRLDVTGRIATNGATRVVGVVLRGGCGRGVQVADGTLVDAVRIALPNAEARCERSENVEHCAAQSTAPGLAGRRLSGAA